jgi:UDP-N-acetylglucosamine--N-acetylmuramyl-(pentapeptide) pyrophosphoryl-undecaprenol N-acetylglucosamine transferase
MANRWLSRLATEAAVAFEESAENFKCPVRLTGVPVRQAFFATPRALPANATQRLLVLGGSQGAQQLNELVPRALALLLAAGSLADDGLEVVHQAGAAKLAATQAAYAAQELGEIKVRIVPFLEDVATEMASSHLLISRAGAITLAEICAASRPSLLVPLAVAAGGHQLANAKRLQEAGAAEVLMPGSADAETMAKILAGLLMDPSRLQRMAVLCGALGRADAASALADRVEYLGRAS